MIAHFCLEGEAASHSLIKTLISTVIWVLRGHNAEHLFSCQGIMHEKRIKNVLELKKISLA